MIFFRALDLDRGYVSSLESGKRNPTLAMIEKIAGALGVSVGGGDTATTVGSVTTVAGISTPSGSVSSGCTAEALARGLVAMESLEGVSTTEVSVGDTVAGIGDFCAAASVVVLHCSAIEARVLGPTFPKPVAADVPELIMSCCS